MQNNEVIKKYLGPNGRYSPHKSEQIRNAYKERNALKESNIYKESARLINNIFKRAV